MRFHFSDPRHAQRLAKLLKTVLADHGDERPLHACRTMLAEACGWPSWYDLETSAGRNAPSPVDEAAGAGEAEVRRIRQRAALARHGVASDRIAAVLDAVRMTGSRPASAPIPTTSPAADRAPSSTRRERVAQRGGIGRRMRVGYRNAGFIVGADGSPIGFCLGTGGTCEHDDPPEGLLEAMRASEGDTLREHCLPRPFDRMVGLDDRGDDHPDQATVVLIDSEDGAGPVAVGLSRDDVRGFERGRIFPAVDLPDPRGILSAWGYDRLVLAAFEPEARKRLRELHAAVLDGRLAVVHHASFGLAAIDTNMVSQETTVAGFVDVLRSGAYATEPLEDHTATTIKVASPAPAASPAP